MEAHAASNAPRLGSCCSAHGPRGLPEPGVAPEPKAWSRMWLKLGVAGALAGQSACFSLGVNMTPPPYATPIYWVVHGLLAASALGVFGILGPPLWQAQWKAIQSRRLTLEALFLLSALGALLGSLVASFRGEGSVYYEVVSIVLSIYTLGRSLNDNTRQQVLGQVSQLRQAMETAWIVDPRGPEHGMKRVPVAALSVGDRIKVLAGEVIPLDGVLEEGNVFVQETALTGEIHPVAKGVGDSVWAGSYALDARIGVRITAIVGTRRLDAAMDTLERARLQPAQIETWAQGILPYFFPVVVGVSVAALGYGTLVVDFWEGLLRAMAVLLVACPCALGLATPLAIWRALLELSKRGMVARTGVLVDALAKANRLVFDKTGTLSQASLSLTQVVWEPGWEGAPAERVLRLVYALERQLSHPVAQAFCQHPIIREAAQKEPRALPQLLNYQSLPGRGIQAQLSEQGRMVRLRLEQVRTENNGSARKTLEVGLDQAKVGTFFLEEKLRPEAQALLQALKQEGCRLSILTGDPAPPWNHLEGVAVESGLSPQQKADQVARWTAQGETVVFVGDGINDAGAMSLASASIAMPGASALAQSVATAVLTHDRLEPILEALALSKATYRKVHRSIRFALAYNLLGIGVAACGYLHPVGAALLMLGASTSVCLEALRVDNQGKSLACSMLTQPK